MDLTAAASFGQAESPFAIEISPQLCLPTGDDADVFKTGYGASLYARAYPFALKAIEPSAWGWRSTAWATTSRTRRWPSRGKPPQAALFHFNAGLIYRIVK